MGDSLRRRAPPQAPAARRGRAARLLSIALLAAGCGPCAPVVPMVDPAGSPGAPPAETRLSITWPGASAEEVERTIAEPVETAVCGLAGVIRVASVSRPSQATVVVESEGEPDTRAILDRLALAPLPDDASAVVIARPAGAVRIDVEPRGATRPDRPRTGRVVGAPPREIRVSVDEPSLSAYGLTAADVEGALSRPPSERGLERPGGEVLLPARARASSAEALGAAELRPGVRLADLATIEDTYAERPRAFTQEGPATLTLTPADEGVALGAWGAIPRLAGPAAVVLVDGGPTGADPAAPALLRAAVTAPGVTAAIWLVGERAWTSEPAPSSWRELWIGAQTAEAAAAAALAVEAAARQVPGIGAWAFAPGDRWARLTVTGRERDAVERAAADIGSRLRRDPRAEAVLRPGWEEPPSVALRVRPQARRLGVREADITRALRARTGGVVVATFAAGHEALDVRLLVEPTLSDLGDLAQIPVTATGGEHAPLGHVAELLLDAPAPQRVRVQLSPAVELYVRVGDGVRSEALVDGLELPSGVTITPDGPR